jgi:RNA polymerase sigma factor (sigma-70 family)
MCDSIADIWNGVLKKDPAAWSKLVHRLGPLVFSVVRRSSLSSSDADDCAQQTWVALFQARHRIKDPDRIPAWLVRVASRTIAHTVRKRSNEARLIERTPESDDLPTPADDVERAESAALLRSAIESLNDRCRRMLLALFFAPGKKTYRDIARELGIPPNSFGPTRARCLEKLRRIMKEMGYE